MLFLQYAFNLSDEELEDQLIDRLSFQQFVGLSYDEEIPDFTTIWKFKEALIRQDLMDQIFESIVGRIEANGLLLKKGTIVDATIIKSGNRPLSRKRREELEKEPNSQIDLGAQSTAKNGKKYFGYKGHIGIDAESKIIRKRTFTPANVHDSQEMENVLSGDEQSVLQTLPTPIKKTNEPPERRVSITECWTKEPETIHYEPASKNAINKNHASERRSSIRLALCERNYVSLKQNQANKRRYKWQLKQKRQHGFQKNSKMPVALTKIRYFKGLKLFIPALLNTRLLLMLY